MAERARRRLPAAEVHGGDLRREELPRGADVISLIRVIHDHDDATALIFLQAARRALGPDGVLLLAEPMAGVPGAEAVGAYFGAYLLALGSGRPRSPAVLTTMLNESGFSRVSARRTGNAVLTGLLVARP